MKSPSIILFDRNENYDKIIKSSLSLKYNPKDILITSFNHFWFRALSVSKDIKRNEIMLAFFHMRDMQNEIMILMRVVHGSYPVGMNYLRPAKRFERDMPEEVIKNISKSFCIYNKEHVIKAFTYCVDFYCKEFSKYVTKQKWLNLCEDRDVLKIQKQIVQILRDDKSLF